MPDINGAIKQEVMRLARKEIRAQTEALRKRSAEYRREIAQLKREMAALSKQMLSRSELKTREASLAGEDAARIRFSPKWLRARRERLELSAAEYAALIGVSTQTIYNWEAGKTKPQGAQLEALAGVRDIGKREAYRRLEAMQQAAAD